MPAHKGQTPKSHEMARLYSTGLNFGEIGRRMDCTPTNVWRILRRMGVATRSHREGCQGYAKRLNHTVFDSPTPEGEYWVGFLMADGCVSKDARSDSWQIVLVASERDRDHIEKFRTFLRSDAKIQSRPGKRAVGPNGYEIDTEPHVRISVTSKQLAESLARFGVVPRKSLVAKVVGLENSADFWRGAVDGDGFVIWHKNPSGNIPLVGLTGSRELLDQFAAFAKSVAPGMKARVRPMGSIFNIRIAGRPAVQILHALYAGGGASLDRKRVAALQMIDWRGRG